MGKNEFENIDLSAEKLQKEKEIDALVIRSQGGDSAAFAEIYDIFVQKVYRYIFFKINNDDDALDLTESVFLKVWQSIRSYKKGKYNFSAWLFRIAHNLVVDHYRLHKVHAPLDYNLEDKKQHSDPRNAVEQSIGRDNLRSALLRLKDSYRQILVLRYINELENEEIARIMKKSEGSLRVLKHRALHDLKRVFKEMGIKH